MTRLPTFIRSSDEPVQIHQAQQADTVCAGRKSCRKRHGIASHDRCCGGWRIFSILILLLVFGAVAGAFLPDPAQAQLRELEVTSEDPPAAIPVFRNYPDNAAVIIYSSLTNLQITSNMGIESDQSRPQDGRYVLLIGPFRQTLTVRASGYQETRIPIPNMNAREVAYFSVEPKDPEPVEGRGTLVLRSIPDGARITVDGYPDLTQQTPYTYELPAQSYRMRVELSRYEPKELVITIPDGQVLSRILELVPTYGFVTIPEQGNLRVWHEGEQNWARVTFTPNRPVELPVGRHRFQLSRDNYETAEEEILVKPGEIMAWEVSLVPSYGFVVIDEEGTLRIRYQGQGASSRVPYTVNRPLELPVGRHELELSREFYEPERTQITVQPGEETRWEPTSRPLYGRLRVRANTPVTLFSDDNHAPPAPRNADYVHMETGRRLVRVTAPRHVTREIMVNVPSGGLVDTTITLMTVADAEDLQRRERQPRGVIRAAADLADAEIWIDGEMVGRGFANQTVITGDYTVEFRHDIGTRTRSVHVPPAGMEEVVVQMRPSRSRAIRSSMLFPGRGHTYTGRSRGYIYGGAFWLAAAGSAAMWLHYESINSDYETALQRYQGAGNLETAAHYRSQVLSLHNDRSQAHDYFEYMLYATAAIYALNVLDILITRPPYGYRTGKPPEGFSLGAISVPVPVPGPLPVPVPAASLTWRRSF